MSEAEAVATEESVAESIGAAFEGKQIAEQPAETVLEASVEKFDFDEAFQTRVAALSCRSPEFVNRVGHLLKPEYFENAGEATLVSLALKYHERNRSLPDHTIMAEIVKEARQSKIIKDDVLPLVKTALKTIYTQETTGREYVEERVVKFARHQATTNAILNSVELVGRGEFEKVEKYIKEAVAVGVNEDGGVYDYFENITARTQEREDNAAGKKPPRGISTGHPKLDEILYHRGWGRKELTTIMGGAKAGKTTALIGFAQAAAKNKHNVLYVSLEVSSSIISDRLDASITDTKIKDIGSHIRDVEAKVKALKSHSGQLLIHEFPSGTFTTKMLRGLIDRYEAKGIQFGLVVVDYADIMAPNHRYNDPIENSKSIYVDLRAVAQEKNVALLTATQTNREGYKATVAKAEHVAEDFNKVRTVDLMISINITDEERSKGEARLYFAASRNQESGFTLFIKQDLAKMKFIESIVRRE